MDSFIDKLAQKFTAQEMITANATADAEELQRIREQVKQYEACLDEMKQVNDSTKDVLDQFASFNQEAREQLEQALLTGVEKINEAQVPTEGLNELVETSLEKINSIQDNTAAKQDELQEKLYAQLQELRQQLMEQLETQNVNARSAKEVATAQFRALKEQADRQGVTMKELLDAQLNAIKAQSAEQLNMMKEQSDAQSDVKELLDEQKEQITDFVHKENVKVYRNVQAAVVEELNKQTEMLTLKLEVLLAKNKTLTTLTFISLGVSAISIVAFVVFLLATIGVF